MVSSGWEPGVPLFFGNIWWILSPKSKQKKTAQQPVFPAPRQILFGEFEFSPTPETVSIAFGLNEAGPWDDQPTEETGGNEDDPGWPHGPHDFCQAFGRVWARFWRLTAEANAILHAHVTCMMQWMMWTVVKQFAHDVHIPKAGLGIDRLSTGSKIRVAPRGATARSSKFQMGHVPQHLDYSHFNTHGSNKAVATCEPQMKTC